MIETFAVLLMAVFFVALVWKARSWLFVVFLFALHIFAQDCDRIVTDSAGMLNGKTADVQQAANTLINQGADVRVRTLPSSGGNLDLAENAIEKSCPSWQGANYTRKSTLVVLMVSKDRKLGLYYGAAWHNAFDAHWNRIKTDYMVPRFKDGNFAGGFIAAEEQLAKRIVASKDEALKPVTSTNVNQAPDVSGIWPIMWGLIIACSFGFGVWSWVLWRIRRNKRLEDIQTAQQVAVADRNEAASTLNVLGDKIATMTAAGEIVSELANTYFKSASEAYGRLGSLITDPTTEGMSKAQYEVISKQYRKILNTIQKATIILNGGTPAEVPITSSSDKPGTEYDASQMGRTDKKAQPIPAPEPTPKMPSKDIYPAYYHPQETNVVVI